MILTDRSPKFNVELDNLNANMYLHCIYTEWYKKRAVKQSVCYYYCYLSLHVIQ